METVYLQWNFATWITVVLMALLGFMVLSFIAQMWHNRNGSAA